jgi:hypothetical protein
MSDATRIVSITAIGADTIDVIGNAIDISITGTFVGTVELQWFIPGHNIWQSLAGMSWNAPAAVTAFAAVPGKYRLNCTAYTSGTIQGALFAAIRT